MRKLDIQKAVLKELLDLPAKQYRQVVTAVFDLLLEPHPPYSKALAGSPFQRLAVGEYRVIYRVDDECVYVVLFGKRNDSDVYKRLDRKM